MTATGKLHIGGRDLFGKEDPKTKFKREKALAMAQLYIDTAATQLKILASNQPRFVKDFQLLVLGEAAKIQYFKILAVQMSSGLKKGETLLISPVKKRPKC